MEWNEENYRKWEARGNFHWKETPGVANTYAKKGNI